MDALPLSLSRTQLELLHESIAREIASLQEQFSSSNLSKREENLLTYGTDEYSEAQERIEAIEEQLKTQLASWNTLPDDSKPVPLDLDSYQLKILQICIKHQIDLLDDRTEKKLLSDVMNQLPEFSLQEDAD